MAGREEIIWVCTLMGLGGNEGGGGAFEWKLFAVYEKSTTSTSLAHLIRHEGRRRERGGITPKKNLGDFFFQIFF